MIPDIDKYLSCLDQYNWPEKDKIEMIRTVWHMMEARADIAFNQNPVQLSCAQNKNIASQSPTNTLSSKGALTHQFHPVAVANDNVAPVKTSAKGDEHAA